MKYTKSILSLKKGAPMDSTHVIETVKQALKTKKITYRELAKQLKMSEAGIKKMFQAETLTVTRLIEICALLGIGLEDLVEAGKNPIVKTLKLNKQQNAFFAKNPDYFLFFLKLVYEGASTDEIAAENRFSENEIFKFLKKLDEYGFIRLKAYNKFDALYDFPIRIESPGEDLEQLKLDLISNFLQYTSKEKQKRNGHLGAVTLHLSDDQTENFYRDFIGVIDQYMRHSRANKVLSKRESLRKVSMVFARSEGSLVTKIGKP